MRNFKKMYNFEITTRLPQQTISLANLRIRYSVLSTFSTELEPILLSIHVTAVSLVRPVFKPTNQITKTI